MKELADDEHQHVQSHAQDASSVGSAAATMLAAAKLRSKNRSNRTDGCATAAEPVMPSDPPPHPPPSPPDDAPSHDDPPVQRRERAQPGSSASLTRLAPLIRHAVSAGVASGVPAANGRSSWAPLTSTTSELGLAAVRETREILQDQKEFDEVLQVVTSEVRRRQGRLDKTCEE